MAGIPSVAKTYTFPKFGSIDDLTLGKAPVPQPGYGEVLLKVHAVALNYREVLISRGRYAFPLQPGVVPGCDCAGEIVSLGPGCKTFKVGDRVMPNMIRDLVHGPATAQAFGSGFGGPLDGFLREYAAVPEYCLVRLPQTWTFEEGATVPCAGVTAYNALLGHVPIKGGDTVLIQGTGGVSIFALQIAVASGARVIATSSSDAKLSIAQKLGAHHLINYRTTPAWEQEVLRLTGGEGVDHIIEVGGPGTLAKSFKCIKVAGVVSNIGFLAGAGGDQTNFSMLALMRGVIFRGVMVGSREQFEGLVRLFDVNGVKPVVDRVFGFGEAKEALRYLEDQKHVGKVVIKVA